jgi:hypothetical protein
VPIRAPMQPVRHELGMKRGNEIVRLMMTFGASLFAGYGGGVGVIVLGEFE